VVVPGLFGVRESAGRRPVSHILLQSEPDGARVFPWEIDNMNNNSASGCLSQCAAFGYTAGGMEFGTRTLPVFNVFSNLGRAHSHLPRIPML
jgi:hypothetical protein